MAVKSQQQPGRSDGSKSKPTTEGSKQASNRKAHRLKERHNTTTAMMYWCRFLILIQQLCFFSLVNSTTPSQRSLFAKTTNLIKLPLPSSVHPRLQELLLPIIEPNSPLEYLQAEQLEEFKKIPGLSGSVQTFIQEQEESLISDVLAQTIDEYGDISSAVQQCLSVDLKHLLRWLVLLLPLAESMESDDGVELVDKIALTQACHTFFSPPAPADRALYLSAVVALGTTLNMRANKVGGVGGKWNTMNGRQIVTRFCLTLRAVAYAPPPPSQ